MLRPYSKCTIFIHIGLVALLLRGGDWLFFAEVASYLLLAAGVILASPLYLQRPVALGLYGLALRGLNPKMSAASSFTSTGTRLSWKTLQAFMVVSLGMITLGIIAFATRSAMGV